MFYNAITSINFVIGLESLVYILTIKAIKIVVFKILRLEEKTEVMACKQSRKITKQASKQLKTRRAIRAGV